MHVAVIQVELRLHAPMSLKDKRHILSPIKTRMKRHFEAACAEVGDLDAWRTTTLGLAVVSNNARHARQRADAILEDLEGQPHIDVVDHQIEIL